MSSNSGYYQFCIDTSSSSSSNPTVHPVWTNTPTWTNIPPNPNVSDGSNLSIDTNVVKSPKVPLTLDARDMIDGLRQYRSFLEELDDMDSSLAQIVDDTIFGLTEAIEALEKLGY